MMISSCRYYFLNTVVCSLSGYRVFPTIKHRHQQQSKPEEERGVTKPRVTHDGFELAVLDVATLARSILDQRAINQ